MSAEYDDELTLEELLAAFREAMQEELHTAGPGRVESYDADAQTVDVKPMVRRSVRRSDGTFAREEMPILRAVPVVWLRTGSWFVHMPIAAGDTVLIVALERDPARWRVTGEVSDPIDRRHHHLAHAVAIPGLFPRTRKLASGNVPSDALVLGHTSGAQIKVKNDGTIELAGTSALTIAPNLAEHLTRIAAALDALMGIASMAPGTPEPNYGSAAKALIDASHPIAAEKVKGA